MKFPFIPMTGSVHLLPGETMDRRERNREYMGQLTTENLLLSHYLEAGLRSFAYKPEHIHGGWDFVTSEIRGTVAGHWLSAAAHLIVETNDQALKLRADHMVAEIARCQEANGGEWAFPIPEKFLQWLKQGKHKWAPQYVCHKNMMGLLDMYTLTGNSQALEIVKKEAEWFLRFTEDISREHMDEMMDQEETGGIMEAWADLYAITGDERHLQLMRRYERPKLYEPLLRGEDVLSNMHANSTIPEMHGAARAYEVTGDERYRQVVENFWDLAVRQRGMYATGGQTCSEIWTPLGEQSARLGETNQEHCTVYNMMRLAEYLLRWTGKTEYADYYERNLYNGIFAQGHWQGPNRGQLLEPEVPPRELVAYFLPLAAGSQKKWGSAFEHFWCCHCTLLQANAIFYKDIYYQDAAGVAVCQYLPSMLSFAWEGTTVSVEQRMDPQTDEILRIGTVRREVFSRPVTKEMIFKVHAEQPTRFTFKFRSPWWLTGEMQCQVNGEAVPCIVDENGFAVLQQEWADDEVRLILPHGLYSVPLPDHPDTAAFMDGPVVLAGLIPEERTLVGDIDDPYTMLTPDYERDAWGWHNGWRTINQNVGWRFKPLYEIGHEVYTVYFPVREK